MATGETNLEFRIKVGGLNELGQLRSSILKLKQGTIEVKDASMALGSAFPKLEGAAKDVQKIFFGQATTMKMLVRNQKVFRNEIRSQTGLLKEARKETTFGHKAWRKYTSEIVRARKQMSGLPLRKLGTDLRNVTNLMLKKAKDLQWVGRQMIVGITAPIGIMLRTSMQVFEAFEKQFVRTTKILGIAGDEATKLRKRMHDLSTELGVSRSMVAALTSDFAQMGRKMLGGGEDLAQTASEYAELTLQLEHVGQVSAQVGRDFIANLAGIIDSEIPTVLNEITGEMEIVGNKVDYVRGLLAKFNIVENTTALSLKDLAEAFPQVSPAAKAAGIDLVFLSGVIGGMRQSGLNATESAHALKFALQRMIAPTAAVEKIVSKFAGHVGSEFHQDLGIGNMMLFKLAENMQLLRDSANINEEGALQYLGALVGKRQASRIFATTLALGSFRDNLEDVSKIFTDLGTQDTAWAKIGKEIIDVDDMGDALIPDDKALRAKFEKIFDTEGSIEKFLLDVHNSKVALTGFSETQLDAQQRSKALNKSLEDLSPPMKAMVIDFMGATSAGKQFQTEFEAVMGGPAMMMQLVRNDIRDLLLDIGTEFFDAIRGMIDNVRGWIQSLQQMSPATKKMIVTVGLLAAALGPVVFILAQMSVGFSTLARVASGVLPKMKDLTRSLMLSKAMAGEQLPLLRRFGAGWIDVGGKAKRAGKNILDTFKAIKMDPAIMPTGFADPIKASSQVIGSGAAAAGVTQAQAQAAMHAMGAGSGVNMGIPATAAGMPMGGGIDSIANVAAVSGMSEEDLKDFSPKKLRRIRRQNQSTWKNSAEDVDKWSKSLKAKFTSTSDSFKKFHKGLAPIKHPSKVFPTAAGMPAAPSAVAQMTPGPSVIKMKQAALAPFRAMKTGMTSAVAAAKSAGKNILKHIGSPMKVLRLLAISSAVGFKLSWTIALKAVKKAMLKAGPIALMVILAAAIMFIVQNLGKFKKAAGGSFDTFKKAWKNIVDTFKQIGKIFFELFEDIFGKKAKDGSKAVGDSMSAVSNVIKKVSEAVLVFSKIFKTVFLTVIPPIIKGVLLTVKVVVKGIGAVLGTLGKHWKSIARVIIRVVYWIVKIIEFFLDVTFRVVQGVIQVLRGLARAFFWLVNTVLLPLFKKAATIFNEWAKIVTAVYKWIANKTLDLIDVIKPVFNTIFTAVDKLGDFFNWATRGKFGWDFDLQFDEENIATFKETVNSAFDSIDSKREEVYKRIQELTIGENITEGLDDGLEALINGLTKVISVDMARTLEEALLGVIGRVADRLEVELIDGWMASMVDPRVAAEARDLAAAIAEEAATAMAEALRKAATTWVGKVRTKFQKEMKKVADSAMKAFEAYSKVYLAAYDTRTKAIQEVIKAEQKLTKTIEYETARRELLSRMAMDKENFIRNRALAIYEGRIEDARNITVKFGISQKTGETGIEKLDTARAKDLLNDKRQLALEEIQIGKKAAAERIQIERDTLAEELALLQEHVVQGEEGWREYVEKVNGFVATGMENAFGPKAAAAKSIEEFAQIVDGELRGKFAELFDDAGVIDEKVTNVGPIVKRETEGWTATVKAFADDSNGMMIAMFEDVEEAWKNELNWEIWAMETALGRDEVLGEIIILINKLEDLKKGVAIEMEEVADSVVGAVETIADGVEATVVAVEDAAARYGRAVSGMQSQVIDLDPNNLQGRRDFTNLDTGAGIVGSAEWWENNLQGRRDFTNLDTGAGIVSSAEWWNNNLQGRTDFTNLNTGAGIVSSDEWWNNNLQGRRNYRYYGGAIKAQYGKYLGGFQSSMVPVMAHGGEYIMSARAVQNVGLSKLESMNHSRNYQGGGGGGTNIFVENFIGEPEWFESMMGEYNVSVAPKNERSRGLESRKISSMADNNKRGRV